MAQIRSITRKRMLWKDFEVADSPWKKTKGIMFRNKVVEPVLFILEKESVARAAIHSFFCLIPFDAIFLNANKEVIDIKENIGAWNPFIAPRKPAKYFIECTGGEAKKFGIKIGERLDWQSTIG